MNSYATPPHTPESRNLVLKDTKTRTLGSIKVKEVVAKLNTSEKETRLENVKISDQSLRTTIKRERQTTREKTKAVLPSSTTNDLTFYSFNSSSSTSSPDTSSTCKISPSSSFSSITSTRASSKKLENFSNAHSQGKSLSNSKNSTPKFSHIENQHQLDVKFQPRHSPQSTYRSTSCSPPRTSTSIITVSSKIDDAWKTWNEAKSKRTEARIMRLKKKLETMEKEIEVVKVEAETLRFEAEMIVLRVDVLLFERLLRRQAMKETMRSLT